MKSRLLAVLCLGLLLAGCARTSNFAATTSAWRGVFDAGLANLIENVKGILKEPGEKISRNDRRAQSLASRLERQPGR